MMKKNLFFTLLVMLVVFAFQACDPQIGENGEQSFPFQEMVDELNSVITPIQGSSPGLPDGELAVLDGLGDARIVGLGEASHGTKEFFEMKHRIFKYLVEHHGFKAFGFECDFAESLYFDRYVTTGVGNLDELMKAKMVFWTWNTGEVKALLQWMKEYNTGKAEKDMIHFYGIDCQMFVYKADLLSEYLEKVDPGFLQDCAEILDSTRDLGYYEYEMMRNEDVMELGDNLNWFYDQIVDRELDLVAAGGRRDYEIARQLARVMVQAHEVNANDSSLRDGYMAENALWMMNLMGDNAKVALWAHNAHVARWRGYMGADLKQELNDAYRILGFAFSSGEFVAKEYRSAQDVSKELYVFHIGSPPEDSVNYLFRQLKYDNFILKIDDLQPAWTSTRWLSESRPFLFLGASYTPNFVDPYYLDTAVTDAFDVVIYFDETGAADNYRMRDQ